MTTENIIELQHVRINLGGVQVHEDINLSIKRGEILGIVGSSGTGKTVLMREMLMLQRPDSGSIKIFNHELTKASYQTLLALQQRWGVLFQANALFSSLNVLENIAFPLKEHSKIDPDSINELALLKLMLVGLPASVATKYPVELSGGMQKRVALARAIALDPELIFLDEPTAGLDPDSASGLDELVLNLQAMMGLTLVIITHDLDTLWRVTNRVAFLGAGRVLCVDTMEKLSQNPHKMIQEFFNGPRGKAAAMNKRVNDGN